MTLHTLHDHDSIERPVMLVALDAFGDAGAVQASVVDLLKGQLDFTAVASFDTDVLLDYRIRRPTIKIRGGLIDRFTWPSIQLMHAVAADDRHVLLLHGPEPDRRWKAFVEEVLDLALRFDASMIIGLASFPGPVPHTRDVDVAVTATDPELARAVPYLPDELEVPSTVHGALEYAAPGHGIAALGLWAPVPQYASMQPYPGAAVALLDEVTRLTGFEVATQTLVDGADASRKRIEAAIADKPDHLRMVQAMEQHVDSMESAKSTDVPTGDELAAEFQRFLEGGDE